MKAALIQMDLAWHDHAANLRKAGEMIAEAVKREATVAILPEMFASGFSMDTEKAVEEPDGPTVEGLSKIASTHGIAIVAGLALRYSPDEPPVNTALVFGRDGSILAHYHKCHPFSPAGEDIRYKAGDGPVVFNLDGTPVSVFICYDLRFPELMRSVADRTLVHIFIANWPAGRRRHWEALLPARAIENQCFVLGVNRTGTDGNSIEYHGGSMAFGPTGLTLLRAGQAEGVYYTEFDPAEAQEARDEFPVLKDRRTG